MSDENDNPESPVRRPQPTETGDSDQTGGDRESLRWLGVGIEFIGVMGLFTLAGYWADTKLHTKPWLMVTGLMISFVGMTYLLYKETAKWRR